MSFKVLIVENEGIVAEDMKGTFLNWGFDVVGMMSDGRTALPIAKDSHPDLLVMDVKINGDLNGVETAIVMKSFFKEELPVIFISGHPASDYPVLKALDGYAYLDKPVTSETLFGAMKSFEKFSNNNSTEYPWLARKV